MSETNKEKNRLIITAHPASYGFAHKIAERYKVKAEDLGDKVYVMDLYSEQYRQDYLEFENVKDIKPTEKVLLIQEKITWADEIILVFPIWWAQVPAILKNFLDRNLTSGFAFKYTKDGLQKMLMGKEARIFATADGPWWVYKLMDWFYTFMWRYIIFGYCGVNVKSVDIFPTMFKKRTDRKREKILKKVEKMV